MENFVLYEEIGKGENSVIYKGRRKGTIHFVAIHCIDKCKRAPVTNRVRLTNELDHKHIVKFYEWYETSNHLWLVVELCTGGSLDTILIQDDHLPESTVRSFGSHLVEGLYHIHTTGIIFCDVNPSKILFDSCGDLKFDDFGLARVEGEVLKDLYEQFSEPDDSEDGKQEEDIEYRTMGTPNYTAPEVLSGSEYSMESDMWSLGCVMYEMFTGHPPFLGESFEALVHNVLHKDYPVPKVKGSRLSSKASPDFLDLIEGLLNKDPSKRLSWHALVRHPFWQGLLDSVSRNIPTQDLSPALPSGRKSQLRSSTRNSLVLEHPTSSALGHIKTVDLKASIEGEGLEVNLNESFRPKSAMAGETGTSVPMFTLSSRPTSAQPTDLLPHHGTHNPYPASDSEERAEITALIYHPSDWTTTNIIDNPKIMKPAQLKYDAKALIVPPYSVDKILALLEKDQQKHIKALVEALNSPEKGPPTQKRMHLLNYTCTLSLNCDLAKLIVQFGGLEVLAKQIKDISQLEHRTRTSRCMGLIASNLTEIPDDHNVVDVISTVTEVLRDNFRNVKMKQCLLPALGELLVLVATQDDLQGEPPVQGSVPSLAYNTIARCLREGEDQVVSHYAVKIVDTLSAKSGPHKQKFANNDTGQCLWYIYTHSTIEALRTTAICALSRLTSLSVGIFMNVIEKAGFHKVLESLSVGVSRIQQASVTMCAVLLSTKCPQALRLLQDKEFLSKVIQLFESPSAVLRAKAFLTVTEMARSNRDLLQAACDQRLVMYIERDSRQQTPRGGHATHDHQEYLTKCLSLAVSTISDALPDLSKEILGALEAVSGRKHPSPAQARQLKHSLPSLSVLQHLVTSQVFRPRVVNREFVQSVGRLLYHVTSVDLGETNIDTGSTSGAEDFVQTVFSILDTLGHHPAILIQHGPIVVEELLPLLSALLASQNNNTCIQALKLFTEICSTYLSADQFEISGHESSVKRLQEIIREALLPQFEQILLSPDPLPLFGLKLFLALIEQNPAHCKEFEALGLVAILFQVLLDHTDVPTCSTMQHLVSILVSLVSNKDTNMSELYDQGLVGHIVALLQTVTSQCTMGGHDTKPAQAMLQLLLEVLYNMLRHLSDVVKAALQAKKAGREGGSDRAERAEQLLMMNKPLTGLTGQLTHLLCYEDNDIEDWAYKGLSLMIQLYGGEHQDSLSPQNMNYYVEAISKADVKKQKVILRILKRLVLTDTVHAKMLSRPEGEELRSTLEGLIPTASSHADVAIASLVSEIIKAV